MSLGAAGGQYHRGGAGVSGAVGAGAAEDKMVVLQGGGCGCAARRAPPAGARLDRGHIVLAAVCAAGAQAWQRGATLHRRRAAC